MFEEKKNNETEIFLKKCDRDLKEIAKTLKEKIDKKDTMFIGLYAYKYTMGEEILDLFKSNKGGLGYYVRGFKVYKNPLSKIIDEFLESYTEPKLITENKLYTLLDKVGLGR